MKQRIYTLANVSCRLNMLVRGTKLRRELSDELSQRVCDLNQRWIYL
nr:MAG TPA: hypothetical protein [Caudoviricetes sp.]